MKFGTRVPRLGIMLKVKSNGRVKRALKKDTGYLIKKKKSSICIRKLFKLFK